MAILDCCRYFRYADSTRARGGENQINRTRRALRGTVYAFACRANDYAFDGFGRDHGMDIITQAQLQCLAFAHVHSTRGRVISHSIVLSKFDALLLSLALYILTGMFTRFLKKYLTLPNVEIHAMLRRVGKEVLAASNGKQEPVCTH